MNYYYVHGSFKCNHSGSDDYLKHSNGSELEATSKYNAYTVRSLYYLWKYYGLGRFKLVVTTVVQTLNPKLWTQAERGNQVITEITVYVEKFAGILFMKIVKKLAPLNFCKYVACLVLRPVVDTFPRHVFTF